MSFMPSGHLIPFHVYVRSYMQTRFQVAQVFRLSLCTWFPFHRNHIPLSRVVLRASVRALVYSLLPLVGDVCV